MSVAFSYQSIGRSLDAVELSIQHALGASRRLVPAAQLGVMGSRGTGRLMLDLGRLPAGPLSLGIAAVEPGGAAAEPAILRFEVPGCGGMNPPGAVKLTPASRRVVRPRRDDLVHARFGVVTKSGGGSLFVTVVGPDGSADTIDAPVPEDGAEIELFAFGASHQLGSYRISATAVSAEGAVGPASETAIELVRDKGGAGPWIDAVSTRDDGKGITIRGGGFTDRKLAVTIGGIAAAVRALRPTELVVSEPEGLDRPGDVVVIAREGVARSRTPWTPPARIAIVPDQFVLAEGESIQLAAVVTGVTRGKVAWSIKGGRGIRIDRSGKVSAELAGRASEFTVVARLAGDRATGTARGQVTAVARERTRPTLGRLGGVVRSADGGSRLDVPAGALAKAGRVAVHPVAPRRRTGRGKDPFVAAEARLEPAGAKLAKSARLELALSVPLEPGAAVPVQIQRRTGGRWETLDTPGVVGIGGNTVGVELGQIPVRVRVAIEVLWEHFKPHPQAIVSPMIASVGPSQLDEGATAAVLVTGANFIPGLTSVEFVRTGGTVENRISVRSVAVTADGTRLGIGLKVGVMEDLAEGQVLALELRLTTPAGNASAPISIRGHDELDVLTGSRTISQSGVFSRMDVEPGARLNVANAFPPVTIECFERAYIRSRFDQSGGVVVAPGHAARGTFGDAGGMGGAGGSGAGASGIGSGGAGGSGAKGSGGVGSVGSAGRPGVTLTMVGAGGTGGAAGGGGPFPHAGGDGGNGTPGRRSPFTVPVIEFAVEPGPGGGGGGGGGGEGWIFQSMGGGGGGGGAGGGVVTIAAGEEVTLQGDVVAAGGDGGFGAYPYTVTSRPSAAQLIQAGGGGGGGGGAGGFIVLQGVKYWSGAVVAVGGNSGRAPGYGPAPVEARTLWQQLLARPGTGAVRVDGEMPPTRGSAFPGPDLDYVYNLLATTAEVELRAPAADVIRVIGSQMQVALFDTETDPTLGGRTRVTLFEGFNDVRSEWTSAGTTSPPLMTCAPIRRRIILFLKDTIPFYEFSCVIAPAAATVPTERSVQLTATVTARPASRVAWDVWGGPAAAVGTVLADATGLGARYTAPTMAPAFGPMVRAVSTFDSSRYGAAVITVVPGIELASLAATGTPATAAIPSVNVGQDLTIGIPAGVLAQTGQTFGAGQTVEFELVEFQPNGTCTTKRVPSVATLEPGLERLTVAVPACAAPVQTVRVPGHGSLPIRIVPTITGIDYDQTNFPNMSIRGSGFDCGTTVVFISGPVPATEILAVSCDRIDLKVRPTPGTEVRVRTAGGTSAGFTAP